jgi:hypothetical protein
MKKEWEGPTWTGFNVGDVLFSIALSGTKGERAAAKVCRGCSPCALRLATGATRAAKNVPAVNGLLSFRVKNLDEVCKVLKTKGVEFLAEPHQQEWTRTSWFFVRRRSRAVPEPNCSPALTWRRLSPTLVP